MEHLPLNTVDDEFAAGRGCAVCGESALAVVHVDDLPDYVRCTNCDSAFILSEAGDWAMFGAISSDYPSTGQTILKRWTTLEAVQAMACSERIPEENPAPIEGVASDPTPPFGMGAGSFTTEAAPTPPFGLGELDEFVAESANGNSNPALKSSEPLEEAADVAEPEPGHRYVVTLAQRTAIFPPERCAHCLRRPAPRKLLVAPGPDPDHGYQAPLCQSCHKRASARSEEQRTAKLVAHLSSILIAGVLIVGALAAELVNIKDLGALDLLLVATLGLVGYGLPAVLLLRRSSRLPPSEDAQFVRSTLRLRDNEGMAFGWRNRGYAELFSTANADLLLGELTRISDEDSKAS
ncbi:MAG: hypothetical protein BMS9Abin28_1467 [Anaerolineae bacterium]|nr:MAG: hypothetical protein BMS9Abin28_1467 [Anaerolineae bacterium]